MMDTILNGCAIKNSSSPEASMAAAINAAQQRGLQRLLQALLREGFLNRDDFIVSKGVTCVPLPGKGNVLCMEGLSLGRAGHIHHCGAISVHRPNEAPEVIQHANELLAYVLPEASQNVERLQSELSNSAHNDALCHYYRWQWQRDLKKHIADLGHTSLFAALLDDADPLTTNPVLLYEQWGCIGHPFHPAHKSKTGLSEEDVLALSPEFQPQLKLVMGALKASVAKASSIASDFCYGSWMQTQFPKEMTAWEQALRKAGEDPTSYLPLPIHPYQAQQVLPHKFADEIKAGLLRIGDDLPTLIASPTLSFRTMASRHVHAPHLKLPVSLQLTSAQRTVSPRATIMGPRVSHALRELLQKENGFNQTLDILAEEVGLHYIDPNNDADRAKHVSILFRENPMTRRRSGYLPIPVAALFADSPVDGRAVFLELVAQAGKDSASGALHYFHDYARTVLQATLSAWLIYGIAFEAHQQNSLMVFNEYGKAEQLLLRDFGDLRIHAPTLHTHGMHIENYQSGFFLFDDETIVREKFLHTTMLCHLAEVAMCLARSYQQHEDMYWQVLYQVTTTLFDQLHQRCDSIRWKKERHAILQADWPVKSLLRMRLDNTTDDICLVMPNPLASFSCVNE